VESVKSIIRRCRDISAQSISPIETVQAALKKMADYDSGALLVMERGKLVGIFSERDYARKIILKGKSSLTTPIHDVMTKEIICVTPEYDLDECLALMSACKIRHLPVLENDRVTAFLAVEDVAFAMIDDNEFLIEELTTYITGSHENKAHMSKLSYVLEAGSGN
jgi:CBS domain-containing protein